MMIVPTSALRPVRDAHRRLVGRLPDRPAGGIDAGGYGTFDAAGIVLRLGTAVIEPAEEDGAPGTPPPAQRRRELCWFASDQAVLLLPKVRGFLPALDPSGEVRWRHCPACLKRINAARAAGAAAPRCPDCNAEMARGRPERTRPARQRPARIRPAIVFPRTRQVPERTTHERAPT